MQKALARLKVDEYDKILRARQASLAIVSSYDGIFSTIAAAGSWVEKGNVLGEMTYER
jgi:hypothetical protein